MEPGEEWDGVACETAVKRIMGIEVRERATGGGGGKVGEEGEG